MSSAGQERGSNLQEEELYQRLPSCPQYQTPEGTPRQSTGLGVRQGGRGTVPPMPGPRPAPGKEVKDASDVDVDPAVRGAGSHVLCVSHQRAGSDLGPTGDRGRGENAGTLEAGTGRPWGAPLWRAVWSCPPTHALGTRRGRVWVTPPAALAELQERSSFSARSPEPKQGPCSHRPPKAACC